MPQNDALADFIVAACVPLDSGHATGTLEAANALLAAHPEIARHNIHSAAILGDDVGVREFLAVNPADATSKAGPHNWDALTHLCFSKYLRLDRARAAGFLKAAQALLDAGASANTGFFSPDHQPEPEFESVLYGAAGIAHDPDLTRLLLERGADPNDGEVVYHTPEGWDDNATVKVLVGSGRLIPDSLATMLLRKTDWHDLDGVKLLLEAGADPNLMTRWGRTALQQAVQRDNALPIIEALLNHGANPTLPGVAPRVLGTAPFPAAGSLAARRGRSDVLKLFEQRGFSTTLQGVERLIAACASNDVAAAHSIVEQEPRLNSELRPQSGRLLAEFSGNGNIAGVGLLLDLGMDVRAIFEEGDGYFGIARHSSALHVAAWRAQHAAVKLLLERSAPANARDALGQTPLALAVRACVDSYWMHRRSPESVRALLDAGASIEGVAFPSGYVEIDELLAAHGAVPQVTKPN